MALLEEIRGLLIAAPSPVTPVTQDQLPDTPDVVVAVVATSGFEASHTMGGGAGSAKLQNPGLEVLARGPRNDRKAARDLLAAARAKLDGLTNTTLSGCRYVAIFAANEGHFVELDENERPVYAQDFTVVKEPS